MRKRLISILLSATLVMTSADITVFAAEQGTEESATTETQEIEETGEEKEDAGSTTTEKESEKDTEPEGESESETQKPPVS